MANAIKRGFDYWKRRRYLKKAKKLGEVQPQIISKDKYLENLENAEDNKSEADEYEIVEIVIEPEKIVCPDCGGITYEGLDFCDRCGGEINSY